MTYAIVSVVRLTRAGRERFWPHGRHSLVFDALGMTAAKLLLLNRYGRPVGPNTGVTPCKDLFDPYYFKVVKKMVF